MNPALVGYRARLDAARAVLARLGVAGAVDGETRASRRRALSEAADGAESLSREARAALPGADVAALRREADELAHALRRGVHGLGAGPLARRRRSPLFQKAIPIVVALVALLQRSAVINRAAAEGTAVRALFLFLLDWLDAWWDMDDYLAEGFACQMGRPVGPPRPVWFQSDTAERDAAKKRGAEERAIVAIDIETAEQGHARRARQHLNAAHLAFAEHGAPFGCDGVFVRSADPLSDADRHLALAGKGIGGAGEGLDVEELRAALARLGHLLTTARAASTKTSADDRRAA